MEPSKTKKERETKPIGAREKRTTRILDPTLTKLRHRT